MQSPIPSRQYLKLRRLPGAAMLMLALFAASATAQTLPPPQLEPAEAPERLADPRHAATLVTEIRKLIDDGSYEAAITEADKAGPDNPRHVELAFLAGVAQARLGRDTDAIASFQALIRDYPELVEPYNNLAVLYAQRNELDKARAALEDAIRVQPSYALAHENLGDVFIRLAWREYDRAARSASTTATASAKLELTAELIQHTAPIGVSTAPASAR